MYQVGVGGGRRGSRWAGFQVEESRLVKVYRWGGSESQEVGVGWGGNIPGGQEQWMRIWGMCGALRVQFARNASMYNKESKVGFVTALNAKLHGQGAGGSTEPGRLRSRRVTVYCTQSFGPPPSSRPVPPAAHSL